jgi:hypothetical protein
MAEILKTMSVQEAAPLWDDPRSVHLKRWGETFAVPLNEIPLNPVNDLENNPQVSIPPEEDARLPILEAEIETIWRQHAPSLVENLERRTPEGTKGPGAPVRNRAPSVPERRPESGPGAGSDVALNGAPPETQ